MRLPPALFIRSVLTFECIGTFYFLYVQSSLDIAFNLSRHQGFAGAQHLSGHYGLRQGSGEFAHLLACQTSLIFTRSSTTLFRTSQIRMFHLAGCIYDDTYPRIRITSIIISRFLLGIRRLALATHDSLPSYFSESYETEQCAEQGRQRSGISTIAFNSNTVSHTVSASTRHTVSLRHPSSEWSEEYSRFTTSGAARYDDWGPDEIVELARVRYTQ